MATNENATAKVGFFGRIGRYFRNMRGEMKRVVWPTRSQVINNTIVVLCFMALAAIFIGALDALLALLLRLFFGS